MIRLIHCCDERFWPMVRSGSATWGGGQHWLRKPARWFHTVSADWFPGRFRFSPLIRESHLKAIFVSFVSHVDWVRQPRTRPQARLPKPAAKRAPIEINEIKVFSSFPIDQKQKLDFRGSRGRKGKERFRQHPEKRREISGC